MRLHIMRLAAITAILFCVNASAQYENSDEECADAKTQARSAASDLVTYARRLQRCAETEDFSYDCSSEFRRVKNSQSDYESAVSDVSIKCD